MTYSKKGENGKTEKYYWIAISEVYGGAKLSQKACFHLNKLEGKQIISTEEEDSSNIDTEIKPRINPNLILTIDTLDKKSNGSVYGFNCAKWKLQKIPLKEYLNVSIFIHGGLEFLVTEKQS
jgi:hypothetical protein